MKQLSTSELLAGSLPDRSAFLLEVVDEFLEEQVVRKFRRALLDTGFEDFNFQQLRCSRSTGAGQVLDALAELPVMTERRLLVLRDVDALSDSTSKTAAANFAHIRSEGLVVLLTYAPSRKKTLPPLLDEASKVGLKIRCALDQKEIAAWVRGQLEELGVKAGRGALEELMERSGENLRSLRSQLERLAMLVGPGGTITKKQVAEVVPFSATVQMWKLTAAVGQRQLEQAIKILDNQLERGENPGTILGYINAYLVSLVQVGGLYKRMGSISAVTQAIPRKKEFQIKKTLQELKTWSGRDLEQAFEMMARADQRLKTGSEVRLVLHLLLFQLCNRRPQAKGQRR